MCKYIAAVVALAVGMAAISSAGTYGDGSGTPEDPCQIWTPEQMNAIGATPSEWGKHFKLMDDIDMSAYTGTQYKVIGTLATPFTGSFDGNGHVIANLTYVGAGYSIGLFGRLGAGGQISNLAVENVNISISSSGNTAGGLVGRNDGVVTGCYASGTVNGSDHVGGLAGSLGYEALLIDCHADANVSGYWRVGGLVGINSGVLIGCSAGGAVSGVPHASTIGGLAGSNYGGTLTDCYATGMVSGQSFVSGLGGLIGDNSNGVVTGCYATGAVSGRGGVGGLMGSSSSYSTVTSCYATGSVSGDFSVGGLMGTSYDTPITHCYATGLVSGNTNFGGLFGLFGGKLNGCFWNTQTSGTTDGVGGSNPDPTGATGKTTAQMKTLSTFTNAGWDFVGESVNGTEDTWRMCVDGVVYPRFVWDYNANSDFTCPDGVTLLDFSILARAWQSTPADDNWDETCDLDGDENIGAGDLAIACGQWLEGIHRGRR